MLEVSLLLSSFPLDYICYFFGLLVYSNVWNVHYIVAYCYLFYCVIQM